MHVSGFTHVCDSITGRFVVLELVLGPDGTVQRFAADFEQHCHDAAPGLFGAVRYNSTIDVSGGFVPAHVVRVTAR